MKKIVTGFIPILFLLSLPGCEKGLNGCFKDTEYEMCLRGTSLDIFNADSTENLMAINSVQYDKDSIKIYDENWSEVDFLLGKDGTLSFNLSDGNYPLGKDIVRNFYLKLEKDDTDTIFFNYRLKNECDYLQFTSFHAYYNSILYSPYNLCPLRFNFYKE